MSKRVIAPTVPSPISPDGIQDPRARAFAQDIYASIEALKSTEHSMEALAQALDAVSGATNGAIDGETNPGSAAALGISQILKSRVYASLQRAIERIDVGASGAAALVENEENARIESDQVFVDAINTIWAAIGVSNAVVQTGGAVAVNYNASQANQWSTLQAEVFGTGGNTIRVALSEEAEARAELDGSIAATWTVRVNANGHFAGFGLGVEGGPGSVQSSFVVNADRFALVTPGGQTVPFYVDSFGAYMNSAFIRELTADKIKAGTIGVSEYIGSTGFVPGGSGNGWRIYGSGYAEFQNVKVRGDVEATGLKVNAAGIVSTLNLANNSVSVMNMGTSVSTTVSTALNTKAGQPMSIVAFGFQDGRHTFSSQGNTFTVTLNINGSTRTTLGVVPTYYWDPFQYFDQQAITCIHWHEFAGTGGPAFISFTGQSGLFKAVVAFGIMK